MSFFLGSWGMNRSAEQTNRPRTASRFTRFVCPALRFIPHEPRKKDTHSLNILVYVNAVKFSKYYTIFTEKSITVLLHSENIHKSLELICSKLKFHVLHTEAFPWHVVYFGSLCIYCHLIVGYHIISVQYIHLLEKPN